MNTNTNDADTHRNTATVTRPHALLTLVESLIRSRRMYILSTHFTVSIISLRMRTSNFIFILVKL